MADLPDLLLCRSSGAARRRSSGLAFFFGLLFITEVALILIFGVDYRFVEARYIGPSLHFGDVDLPLRMLVPVRRLADHGRRCCSSSSSPQLHRPRDPGGVAGQRSRLQLMAVNPTSIKRIAFGSRSRPPRSPARCLIIIQPVEPSIGRDYIGRVFAICVLGGMGSFPGMVIAAMLLGVVESLTATFYGPPGRRRWRSASCC